MPAPPSLRDPSSLFFQRDGVRRAVVASYWALIILAVPLWWSTTSITRLSLPSNRVQEQATHNLQLPVTICLQSASQDKSRLVWDELKNRISSDEARWKGLELVLDTSCKELGSDAYTVIPHNGDPIIAGRTLKYSFPGPNSASQLAEALTALIAPYSQATDPDRRVVQYAPRYRLSFSLLNEDASAGGAIVKWDILRGLKAHIFPILEPLRSLHNFTIESQVQYHAPLAFSPREVDQGFAVAPADLTVFVNSAEWTLSSSSSNDPVLHFVLFIPSAERRPLHILAMEDIVSPSHAFLLPQWGGIVIHNPQANSHDELLPSELETIFASFANQLTGLLGVPRLPTDIQRSPDDMKNILSDWQLDALLRRRTLENTSGSLETLQSIVKLVDQIENMPVQEDVRDDVENALTALTNTFGSSRRSLRETFANSAESLGLASRAFFNPGMLALLYFPAEHKYAVYAPLFASAVIPLVVAGLKELSAWKKERKANRLASQIQT